MTADQYAAIALIVLSLLWIVVSWVARVPGDTTTYWLNGEPISRAEHDHLTGGR